MTKISELSALAAYSPAVAVPGFDPNNPSVPDVQVPLGKIGGYRGNATVAIATLAANTDSDQVVTVPGARDGDMARASITSAFVAGLAIMGARVSADDTVSVRLRNITGSSISPGSLAIVAHVIPAG